jgi:hypothetical protein
MIERTGRLAGDADIVSQLEALTGRQVARRKPGQKPEPVRREGAVKPSVSGLNITNIKAPKSSKLARFVPICPFGSG